MFPTQAQLDQISLDLDLYASWVAQADVSALDQFPGASAEFSRKGIGTALIPSQSWGAEYDHESGQLDQDWSKEIKSSEQWSDIYQILWDLAEDYARFAGKAVLAACFRSEDESPDDMIGAGYRPAIGQDPSREDCIWIAA